jgi:hypothetical protein
MSSFVTGSCPEASEGYPTLVIGATLLPVMEHGEEMKFGRKEMTGRRKTLFVTGFN